jgi:antitoxin Phd
MKSWPVQDAKARFSELLETCLREGPQVVTRCGEQVAVLVPMSQWQQLVHAGRPTLNDFCLAISDEPSCEFPRAESSADAPCDPRRNRPCICP